MLAKFIHGSKHVMLIPIELTCLGSKVVYRNGRRVLHHRFVSTEEVCIESQIAQKAVLRVTKDMNQQIKQELYSVMARHLDWTVEKCRKELSKHTLEEVLTKQ